VLTAVFWDGVANDWSTEGVATHRYSGGIVAVSDHLTDFGGRRR